MAKIPTITSEQYAPGTTRVPDGTLQVPGPVSPRLSLPPASTGAAGGLAAAGAQLGDAVATLGAQLLKAGRARKVNELHGEFMSSVAEAQERVRTADPADAARLFDEQLASIRDRLGDVDDRIVRDRADQLLSRMGDVARLEVKREAVKREIDANRAVLASNAERFIFGVTEGHITSDTASTLYAEALRDQVEAGTVSSSQAEAMQRDFEAAAVREEFGRLLSENPARALGFISYESELARRVLTADERSRREQTARRAVEERNGDEAEIEFQTLRERIRSELAKDDDTIDGAALRDLIDRTMRPWIAHDGFKVAGRFTPGRVATPDELRLMLLGDELVLAAAAGDQVRVDAISAALPSTVEGRRAEQNARTTLAGVLKSRQIEFDGAKALRSMYVTRSAAPADAPRDERSLDRFYQDSLELGDRPQDIAEWIAREQLPVPKSLIRDLRNSFDEATLDLEQGLAMLASFEHAGNRHQAERLARSSGEMSLTLWRLTRDLAEGDPRRQSIIGTFSDGRAAPVFASALLHLNGDGTRGNPPVSRKQSLGRFGPLERASAELHGAFKAQYLLAFTRLGIFGQSHGPSMSEAAARTAATALESEFVLLGGSPVRANLGIGSMASPSRHKAALERAMNDIPMLTSESALQPVGGGRLPTWMSGAPSAWVLTPRPDLHFPIGEMAYIPSLDPETGETHAFLEWNTLTQQHRTIRATGKPLDGAVHDAALFAELEDVLKRRSDPADLGPHAMLRYRSEYGEADTLGAFHERTGVDLRPMVTEMAWRRWMQSVGGGDPPDMDDPEQRRAFGEWRDHIMRNELRWRGGGSFSGSGGGGE